MKLSKLTAIIFTGALACSLTLTGCNEKTAKLEPNNWNCRDDDSIALVKRLEQQEQEGKIKDASLFLEKCKQAKLGFFSDTYQRMISDKDLLRSGNYAKEERKLYAQWQKEAGVNPNDY